MSKYDEMIANFSQKFQQNIQKIDEVSRDIDRLVKLRSNIQVENTRIDAQVELLYHLKNSECVLSSAPPQDDVNANTQSVEVNGEDGPENINNVESDTDNINNAFISSVASYMSDTEEINNPETCKSWVE